MFSPYRFYHIIVSRCLILSGLPSCRAAAPAQHEWQRIEKTALSRARRGASAWVISAIAWAIMASQAVATDVSMPRPTLSVVDRTVTQDQGRWVIDYRLRHTGKTGVIVTPEEIAVKVEGWVSNSRVATHAVPRWSSLALAHGPDLSAMSEVITAADEGQRCRERLVVSVWAEDQDLWVDGVGDKPGARLKSSQALATPPAEAQAGLPLSVGPGSVVRARLRLEHLHILYGEYDVLLAVRAVTLSLGSAPIQDIVPLDHEHYLAQPRFTWSEPPEERRDTRHSISGPDSLHLEAHVPGHQYYRYPERPVRYGTKMRLQFWYLIAAGTEGDCKVKVGQFKETPITWRSLAAAALSNA